MLAVSYTRKAVKDLLYLPFPHLIFQMRRDTGVPIWLCGKIISLIRISDIGVIKDKANEAAPREVLGSGFLHLEKIMQTR